MLTVRYEWLGLCRGERLLDFGCGAGRHALEAMRLGAAVTAVDSDRRELAKTAAWALAMLAEDPDTAKTGGQGHVVVGDGMALPFPDGCFDKVVAAEVLEHVPHDSAVMAELARRAATGGRHRGHRAPMVPRARQLGTVEAVPQCGRRPHPHLSAFPVGLPPARRGPPPIPVHHAHALAQPVLVAALRVRDLGTEPAKNPVSRAYHRLLVWDITAKSPLTRWPEAVLNPVLGKSLVIYARKSPAGCAP